MLIVKFNDYQCPACGQAYMRTSRSSRNTQASQPGAVRVVMKDYPLEPNAMRTHGDASSGGVRAAVAVRLAQAHNAARRSRMALHASAGNDAGVGAAGGARHRAGDRLRREVCVDARAGKRRHALGQQLEVKPTPTFFINGVKIDGMWAPQFFDQAIAYELKRAQ